MSRVLVLVLVMGGEGWMQLLRSLISNHSLNSCKKTLMQTPPLCMPTPPPPSAHAARPSARRTHQKNMFLSGSLANLSTAARWPGIRENDASSGKTIASSSGAADGDDEGAAAPGSARSAHVRWVRPSSVFFGLVMMLRWFGRWAEQRIASQKSERSTRTLRRCVRSARAARWMIDGRRRLSRPRTRIAHSSHHQSSPTAFPHPDDAQQALARVGLERLAIALEFPKPSLDQQLAARR